MMDEQLVPGAGSFWGAVKQEPQPVMQLQKEWDLTERVVFETEESTEAHAALDQVECENVECRMHHDEDCMCMTCAYQEANGFASSEDDHEHCEDCNNCLDCEECTCLND